jgi:type III pantothenate kinase
MLLALDIGNSNIKIGIWDKKKWKQQRRLETYPIQSAGEYCSLIKQLFEVTEIETAAIQTTVIGSVVPQAAEPIKEALTTLFGKTPLRVGAGIETGISFEVDHPAQVGADLIAGAAGAYALVKGRCIVVDFGTATTVMAVEDPGVFTGGVICAGLKVSAEALTVKAAQLQNIPLEMPASVMGKNTIECMQSGLIRGHLCMIEGLIERMKAELGPAQVIATGGLLPVLASHTAIFDYTEPTLILDGLRLIAEKQA